MVTWIKHRVRHLEQFYNHSGDCHTRRFYIASAKEDYLWGNRH